jgi:hypothetical protein
MQTNHYGKLVDSELPIVGVINTNSINWEFIDNEICLTCNKIIENIQNDNTLTDDEKEEELEYIECDSDHTKLIGDWVLTNGKYEPDLAGEFAAIVDETYVQVVFSSNDFKHCKLCSPCFPGQGDLNSIGDYITYALPEYLTERN